MIEKPTAKRSVALEGKNGCYTVYCLNDALAEIVFEEAKEYGNCHPSYNYAANGSVENKKEFTLLVSPLFSITEVKKWLLRDRNEQTG